MQKVQPQQLQNATVPALSRLQSETTGRSRRSKVMGLPVDSRLNSPISGSTSVLRPVSFFGSECTERTKPMPTIHLTTGSRFEYDRVVVKSTGWLKAYNQVKNPDYDRDELDSDKFLQTDRVAYPPHRVDRVEGDRVTYERPSAGGV